MAKPTSSREEGARSQTPASRTRACVWVLPLRCLAGWQPRSTIYGHNCGPNSQPRSALLGVVPSQGHLAGGRQGLHSRSRPQPAPDLEQDIPEKENPSRGGEGTRDLSQPFLNPDKQQQLSAASHPAGSRAAGQPALTGLDICNTLASPRGL